MSGLRWSGLRTLWSSTTTIPSTTTLPRKIVLCYLSRDRAPTLWCHYCVATRGFATTKSRWSGNIEPTPLSVCLPIGATLNRYTVGYAAACARATEERLESLSVGTASFRAVVIGVLECKDLTVIIDHSPNTNQPAETAQASKHILDTTLEQHFQIGATSSSCRIGSSSLNFRMRAVQE